MRRGQTCDEVQSCETRASWEHVGVISGQQEVDMRSYSGHTSGRPSQSSEHHPSRRPPETVAR